MICWNLPWHSYADCRRVVHGKCFWYFLTGLCDQLLELLYNISWIFSFLNIALNRIIYIVKIFSILLSRIRVKNCLYPKLIKRQDLTGPDYCNASLSSWANNPLSNFQDYRNLLGSSLWDMCSNFAVSTRVVIQCHDK